MATDWEKLRDKVLDTRVRMGYDSMMRFLQDDTYYDKDKWEETFWKAILSESKEV